MKIIPYGSQSINLKDIKNVSRVLRNDRITTGAEVLKFENNLKNYFNCRYVLTCNSGTSALYLALASIKIKIGDVIIMPSINFIASYNMAKKFGAKIFLADVDSITGQMTPQNIIDCCRKFNLKKVKAVIAMYHSGYPNNAENFIKIKKKLKCLIIEDACHAFGAEYVVNKKKYKIGSCKHADISTFSLHPLKTITTGEGGIFTTNNKNFLEIAKNIRSHGIVRNKTKHWKYDVIDNGFNFRLNDFQCALGNSQLKRVKKFLDERKLISDFYDKKLKVLNSKLTFIEKKKNYKSSNHLYLIKLKNPNLKNRERFIKYMSKNKIIAQYHYIPIYKFKCFKDKSLKKNSEIFYRSALSLPIFVGLKKKELVHIIKHIKKFFN